VSPESHVNAVIRARHGEAGTLRTAWYAARSVVFWIWQIVLTLVMGGPVLLISAFSYRLGYPVALAWLRLNFFGLRAICGVRWEVQGRENIPDAPCLVMSKHQSTWETYFLPHLFVPATYVAKRSLRWVPIFGWSLVALRFILIDRASGRSAVRQMIDQSRDRLSRGRWIIIFPEGTRRPVGAEPDYRAGGAIVAAALGTPVLPVAVNAGEFWPRMGFIKWPGTISVRIGSPIPSAGRKAGDVIADTEAWIEGAMQTITSEPFRAASVRSPGKPLPAPPSSADPADLTSPAD